MRKSLWRRMFSTVLCMTVILAALCQMGPAYAEEPKAVRIERTVSTSETEVGEKFTVSYRIFGDEIKIPRTNNEIAVIIDTSGSMAWTLDGQSTNNQSIQRITIAKNGAKNFINNFKDTNTKISIIPFDSQVSELSNFEDMMASGSTNRLNSYIDKLKAVGGTNLGDSFRMAYHTLNEKGSADAKKHIVVLTDGDPTFYTYTGTINKSSFAYYMGKGLVGSVSGVKINTGNDFDRGFEYARIMGEFLKNKKTSSGHKKFNFHIIGFADNSSSLDSKLNQIGKICGADIVPTNNNKYYYKALNENDLKAAYDAIWGKIAKSIPFGTLHFTELLPADIVLTPEAEKMLTENNGFLIKKIQEDGKQRIQITGDLSGSMVYKRSEPDGDIYQILEQELSFEISVTANKAGNKLFEKGITTIDYTYCLPDSPDNSISGKASNENETKVKVNLKDSKLEMLGSLVVLQGCTANLKANVTVGDAEDIKVDEWSSPDTGEIINIVKKEDNVAEIEGLKVGKTTVKATAKSAKEWYKTATAQCSVHVIGVETRNIYLLKESITPESIALNKYLDIKVPEGVAFDKNKLELKNITFGAGETINGNVKTDKDGFVQIDASNNIRGIKATGDSFITLRADIKYGEQTRTLEWKIYVIDVEITPSEKLTVKVWESDELGISYNLPVNVESAEMTRISDEKLTFIWSFDGTDIDVKGEDINKDGKIDKLSVRGSKLTGDEGVTIEMKVRYVDSLSGVPVQEKATSRKIIVNKSLVDIQ